MKIRQKPTEAGVQILEIFRQNFALPPPPPRWKPIMLRKKKNNQDFEKESANIFSYEKMLKITKS